MTPVWYIIFAVLGVLAVLALGTVYFCMRAAKSVLHPISNENR